MRLTALTLLLIFLPLPVFAQTGREFIAAETYVATSRIVYLGKIVELKETTYGGPLTEIQKFGKPYRMVFAVDEAIRGEETERLDLILSLQSTIYLEYMRAHSVEILLAAGPTRLDRNARPRVGIAEQGKPTGEEERYHFRILETVDVPDTSVERQIATQINQMHDSARMFTTSFDVATGREDILKRVRQFASKYKTPLPTVMVGVPNEFGELCGNPNAFCSITLPVCPETKTILLAIQNDPNLIMHRIKSRNEEYDRERLATEVKKALASFPEEASQ
ncbi:MAG: hypothetical protein H6824_01580 [Planctomycetaceae bacterium]|nr:hypothetical protein [Planctomycetaceae bacterium]